MRRVVAFVSSATGQLSNFSSSNKQRIVNLLTRNLAHPPSEFVPLLQHSFSALFDEHVEFRRERRHALAQVFEIEIDARQLGEWIVTPVAVACRGVHQFGVGRSRGAERVVVGC